MATNFDIIQQLMNAGKLPAQMGGMEPMTDMSAPATGSQPLPPAPVVPPAGQVPTQMPFEAPMQPQARHVQQNPMKGIQESQKGIDAAFNRQEEAVQQAAALGQQRAAEETAFQIEQDKMLSKYDMDKQKAEQERQVKTQEAMNKLSQIQEEYAGMKVDPNRYWANRSTNGKILTAISLIFGAAGSGTTNQAATILQNAINQDLELQKLNIDKKGNELNQQKGLLSEMRTQFGDIRTAEAATRAIMLDAAQRQMQIIGGKYRGPEQAAKLEQAMGQLEAEKQKAIGDFYKTTDDMNFRRASLQLERDKMGLEFAKGAAQDVQNRVVTVRDGVNPDGTVRYGQRLARDPEAAKKARDTYGAAESLINAIDEAIAFRKEYGRESIPGTEGYERAKQIQNDIILQIKELRNLGALDKGAIAVGTAIAANPGKIFSQDSTVINNYNKLRESVFKSTNNTLRQYGNDIQLTDPKAQNKKQFDFQPSK
jgi:hypothetical protein